MKQERPKYFFLLNESDQESYLSLQESLLSAAKKRHRGQRLIILKDCLEKIIKYAHQGNSEDNIRCCVCGVCQLNCGIAINSRQLKFLINKCKSSVNGALKLMGYKTTVSRGDINSELVTFLSMFKANTKELRQWSIRTTTNASACVNESNVPQKLPNDYFRDFKINEFDIECQLGVNESDFSYTDMIDANLGNDDISLTLTDFNDQAISFPF